VHHADHHSSLRGSRTGRDGCNIGVLGLARSRTSIEEA
jgi:hypothetical protein